MERKYSPQEKLQIIMMVFKTPKKRREILGKHDVSQSTFYKWKSRFMRGGIENLREYQVGPKGKHKPSEAEQELASQLQATRSRLDQVVTELELLKKKRKLLGLE